MFKINRVRLRLFTGMWLTEIDEFDMRTSSPTTIIIGRNGCGKSRLLGVLYPICPAKSDFRDGGDYLNESEIDGTEYSFHCKRVGNSMKCTIRNMATGEYLIKNVNPKVYNAKVADLLNIDPALVGLLIGVDDMELCRLSTGQRRHWFTRLSVSDLSYPLAVHKRLKDYSRDLVGAIKHGQMKIADIKPRVVECASEREHLSKHIESLRAEVEDLTARVRDIVADPSIDRDTYVGTLDNLERVSSHILKSELDCSITVNEIEAKISLQQTTVGESRARYQHSQNALGELLAKKQRQEYQLRNSVGLIEQVETLQEYMTAQIETRHAFPSLYDYEKFSTSDLKIALGYVNEFSTDLTRAIDAVTTDEPLHELERQHLKSIDILKETEEKLRKLDTAISELRHSLDHFLSVDDVDCPKCTTRFKPGLVNLDVDKVRKDIFELEETKKRGEAKLETFQYDAEKVKENYQLRKQVRDIVMSYSKNPVLCLMFTHLHEADALVRNRGSFPGIVSWFVQELTDSIEVSVEHAKLMEKTAQLDAIKAESNIDDTNLDDDIKNVESVSRFQQDSLAAAETSLKSLEGQRKTLLELAQLTATFEALVLKASEQEGVWMLNEYRDAMSVKRKEVFDSYSVANSRFNEMDEEYRRLVAIEEDVADLQKRQEVATLLVRAMSPEKGLLRKHFYRAISRITDMMNKHIDAVWQYHLKVMPCNVDDTDLDYKFPFMVGDNEEPADDVKQGSAAQREIFNLVYRLTAFKALGLEGFPLILDEPGHTFDEGHRDELVDFIKRLLGSGEHSQSFIVSHNSDVHSRLSGADFVVISEDGITPPTVFNEIVKIVYRG